MLSLLQTAFNSGEVSPSIAARVDIEKYKSSLETCRNFIVHAQGGASNRCGMQYIASTKYATFSSASVAQEFIFSQTQAYVLEFGHLYVRFYREGAQIQQNGVAYQVATTYLESDLRTLRFESSADVIYIMHPSYQTQTLTRYAEKDWRLEDYAPEDGPFMPENIDEGASLTVSAVTGSNVTLTLSAVTMIDPYLVVLLHGDGIDASTTITDSTNRHAWTVHGNAQIDTAQKVFGTGSILFDGTGDYISTPDSADFFFDTGDFTIRGRFKTNTLGVTQTIYQQLNSSPSASDQTTFVLKSDNTLQFSVVSGGISKAFYVTTSPAITDTNFHDIMLVRNGSSIIIYVDGVSQALTVSTPISTNSIPNLTGIVAIGADISPAFEWNGWIDELAIYKGIAKETSDFSLPTAAFSTSTLSTSGGFSFDPLHVGALFKLRHYIEGQTVAQAFTSATTSSGIKCFTTWRIITHGTWAAKFNIEKSTDGGTTWTVLRAFSGTADFNANTSGTEDIDTNPIPFLVRINVTSYTSGTLNVDLTTDPFYQDGILRTTSWNSLVSMQSEVLQTIGSTSPSTSWSEGSWSDYRGYPRVGRFFQDRLDFASTPSEPQTDWLSKTSNYVSFIRNSPLLDTDGITVNLPSRQLNAINGLIAFKKLLAFTSSSVWSIGPVSGTALTPTSVQQDVEEYSGSSGIEPVVLGVEAIYMDTAGEIVKSIGFQLANDGFIGNDVNVLAKHLFEGYTIIKMAYQRSPNSIIWMVRSDGVLLSLTYMKEQDVVAFAHHDTDGDVESICVIPGETSDELWLIVSRDGGKYMERMMGRKQHDLTDHIFLDSYVHYDNSTTTVSSLTHIANKVVSLVGDGVDLGTKTVSSTGTLGLSALYTSLDVGLSFDADLGTLAINIPTKEGTVQGNQIKVGNVTFRLINTFGGYLGPNENNLYEGFGYDALNRANQLKNKASLAVGDYFSGDVRVPLGAGYENGGKIFYRQSRPFPVTIASIIPEVNIGGKVS